MYSINCLKQLRRSLWALAALAACATTLAADAVYTWKDASGRVHYGNKPPKDQTVIPVEVGAGSNIYTWTDAEGKVHYGGHPPQGTAAKQLQDEDGSLSTIHRSDLRPGEERLLRDLP